MIQSIEKNKCTGCQMCAEICPTHAIEYQSNEEGFWYPIVNEQKCIHCKKCIKICPSLNKQIADKEEPKVYKVWIKDKEIRLKSTSGGVYYAFAQHILKNGGYIVGSIYEEGYKSARHIISNSIEDLEKVMGSKYFQSNLEGIYTETKKILDTGKIVLFCGAPCQCAAIQKFLGKSYDNLITLDFICRGINSPKAFRKYIEELEENYQSEVEYVRLKSKKTGWTSLATFVKFKNGKEYHKDRTQDLWIKGYIQGNLYMRRNCQECLYKEIPRISDLTMGDFWGIKDQSENDMFCGISVLLVNSKKGMELFEKIQSEISYEERTLEEATNGNPCILNNAKAGKNREKFFTMLDRYGFAISVKKCSREKVGVRAKKLAKKIIKKMIRR